MNDIVNTRLSKNNQKRLNKNRTINQQLITQTLLNCFEAEREVLDNLYKIERMQFLGLRDKNGKLIYFGDILKDDQNNLLTPAIEVENNEHVLFFKPINHLNHPSLNIGCKSAYSQTLEVIGNIYTNSELFSGMHETDKLVNFILPTGVKVQSKITVSFEQSHLII